MRLFTLLAGGTAAAVTLSIAPAAAAAPAPTAVRADPPVISGEALMDHLREFQKIADANGNTRAHGRPGYKASVDYVKGKLSAAGYEVTLQDFTHSGSTGWNLVAEWPHGDASQTVMLGAHLDSVAAGPGVNDNGSGSAALLEYAVTLAKVSTRPQKRLRFAWWGAEEAGLIGSKHYVKELSADDKKKISLYLNFDMVGVKGLKKWRIYKESPDVAATWKQYFADKQIPTEDYQASSDQLSFKEANLKVSGFGGKSDDSCYHKACDSLSNVTVDTMTVSANAIAAVSWKLAGGTRRH